MMESWYAFYSMAEDADITTSDGVFKGWRTKPRSARCKYCGGNSCRMTHQHFKLGPDDPQWEGNKCLGS